MAIELQHLSYSSIHLYQTCPRAWKYRYVDKVQVPTSPALAFGSAFHNAVEGIIRARVAGQPCDPGAVWAEAWGKASSQEIAWDGEMPETLDSEGYRMLCNPNAIDTLNRLEPLIENGELVIEKRIELRVPSVPVPVLGFIDMLGADYVPMDFKTSSKAWTQDQADREVQPLFYLAALMQTGYGMHMADLRFRHCVFTKTKAPQVQVLESKRSAGALFWLFTVICEVWRGIEREVFPANPGAWSCSQKWCNYWGRCRGH